MQPTGWIHKLAASSWDRREGTRGSRLCCQAVDYLRVPTYRQYGLLSLWLVALALAAGAGVRLG